jgi:membrane peptidoglycan carboxypeptidase
MRRPTLLLLAGCVVAGTAALVGGDVTPNATVAAAMDGDVLDPVEVSKFQNLDTGSSTAQAATIDSIDLDKITRDGDHYVAPLADGRKAILTLDPDLQELAEKLLDESRAPKGAIVVMAPDGAILALAGRKTEEPKGSRTGTFDWRLATEVWAPAASIFKLVTASALVKAGVDPDAKVCYHGGLRSVLEHNLQDDKRDNRCESLSYGVAHSQNAILGKLAFQKLGPTTLEAEAKAFGWIDPLAGLKGAFGELELPQEQTVELARAAAGFKGARLSVMGGALLTATFANAGEQPTPRLVASIDGKPVAAPAMRRAITAEQAAAVARMMAGTCNDGSAAKTFARKRAGSAAKVSVAGKTGTLTEPSSQRFYTWFTGFAPSRPVVFPPEATKDGHEPAQPRKIAFGVLVVNDPKWTIKANVLAREVLRAYFAAQKVPGVTSPRSQPREAGPPAASTTPATKQRLHRGS